MALYGDLTFDSRVRREARTLADAGLDVRIVCLDGDGPAPDLLDGVDVQVIRPNATPILPGGPNPFLDNTAPGRASPAVRVGWLRDYVRNLRTWGRLAVRAAGDVDVWHAHDLTGLAAVGPLVDRAVPLVYDAHELFLETGTALHLPGPARALLRGYERRLVSRAAAVVTVNDGLAEVLAERYHPARILAVHNCPDRWAPPATKPTLLRDATDAPGEAPLILYHGALSEDRGIEQLMEALLEPGLERVHLVLLGYGELRGHYDRAAHDPRWAGRVHLLDPVAPVDLLSWIASADVGAMPIQPTTLNLRLSTPNKLFECLAAGIPVVASDFPALRRIVLDDPNGPLGTVCDPTRVSEVGAAIRSILESDRSALGASCIAAARARWNWEIQGASLVNLYVDLAGAGS